MSLGFMVLSHTLHMMEEKVHMWFSNKMEDKGGINLTLDLVGWIESSLCYVWRGEVCSKSNLIMGSIIALC